MAAKADLYECHDCRRIWRLEASFTDEQCPACGSRSVELAKLPPDMLDPLTGRAMDLYDPLSHLIPIVRSLGRNVTKFVGRLRKK